MDRCYRADYEGAWHPLRNCKTTILLCVRLSEILNATHDGKCDGVNDGENDGVGDDKNGDGECNAVGVVVGFFRR